MAENIEYQTLEDLDQALDKEDITFYKGVVFYRIHKAGRFSYQLFIDGESIPFQHVENLLAFLVLNLGKLKIDKEHPYVTTFVTPRGEEKVLEFQQMLKEAGAIISPDQEIKGSIKVIWRSKEQEQTFQTLWAGRKREPIDLYEDGEGNLYLHQHGSTLVYETDPYRSAITFQEECEGIARGDTYEWEDVWVHEYAQMRARLEMHTTLIATWHPNKPYELHCQPGSAGKRYLKLTD